MFRITEEQFQENLAEMLNALPRIGSIEITRAGKVFAVISSAEQYSLNQALLGVACPKENTQGL